jgi:hypothetical protein
VAICHRIPRKDLVSVELREIAGATVPLVDPACKAEAAPGLVTAIRRS